MIPLKNVIMENMDYTLFSESIVSENGRNAYGISCRRASSGDEAVVRDITSDLSTGEQLFDMIVRNAVYPVHIRDVVLDFIS